MVCREVTRYSAIEVIDQPSIKSDHCKSAFCWIELRSAWEKSKIGEVFSHPWEYTVFTR